MSSIMNKNAFAVILAANLVAPAKGHFHTGPYFDSRDAGSHTNSGVEGFCGNPGAIDTSLSYEFPIIPSTYTCGWYTEDTYLNTPLVPRQAWACLNINDEKQACATSPEDTNFCHPSDDNRDRWYNGDSNQYEPSGMYDFDCTNFFAKLMSGSIFTLIVSLNNLLAFLTKYLFVKQLPLRPTAAVGPGYVWDWPPMFAGLGKSGGQFQLRSI